MRRPSFAGGPLWELAFKSSEEVGACFTFWSVAYMAGLHRRISTGVRSGVMYRERYRSVPVHQSPDGVLGSWMLRLTEHVRVPRPVPNGGIFPPTVTHELVVLNDSTLDTLDNKPVDPPIAGRFREEAFRRPPLIVHMPSGEVRTPAVEMATPTAMLDREWSSGLCELARYATWLAIAQRALLQQRTQIEGINQ